MNTCESYFIRQNILDLEKFLWLPKFRCKWNTVQVSFPLPKNTTASIRTTKTQLKLLMNTRISTIKIDFLKFDKLQYQNTALVTSGAAYANCCAEKDFWLEHFILLATEAYTYCFQIVPLRLITTALVLPIAHSTLTPHIIQKMILFRTWNIA